MKKKIVGIMLLISLASLGFMPNVATGVSTPKAAADTSTYNDIIIDGLIGTDWTDGNYTVRSDLNDWGWNVDTWHADGLYAALNATGFALGLEMTLAGPSGDRMSVFIDIDQGGEGLDDFSKSSLGVSNVFASDAFIPDFVLIANTIHSDASSLDTEFMIYNLTDNAGASVDLSSFTGYASVATNHSDWDDVAWSNPIIEHYEAFIPWDLFFPAGMPTNTEIRLFADGAGDQIPHDKGYVALQVADDLGDPELVPYTIGWPGQNGDGSYTSASVNELDGNVTLGLEMEFYYEIWNTDGKSEYINNSQWPLLNIIYYNSTLDANTSIMEYQMYHETGDLSGSNEIYRYEIPLLPEDGYAVGDKFWWYITAGDIDDATAQMYYEVENGISAMPPIDLDYIGAVTPAGGFQDADESFEVEVQLQQLWNGTDEVTFDVLSHVFINFTLNATDVWAQTDMAYAEASSNNAIFRGNLGGFPNGTTVTFYVVAENNNTVQTGPYLIHIGIEPPKTEIFYMTDPEGDEWGSYPTNAAFGPGVGLFDILEFNVSANAYGTQFDLRLLDSYDPGWGGGNFSHQMFVVLIDIEAGGTTEGVLASNVETQADYPWDIGFYADNWVKRYFTPTTIAEPQTAGTGITTGYEMNGEGEHWFNFYVPETLINTVANSTWKYYVMSASADFNNFRNHMAENGEWHFGGGDDGMYDPNYCDILVPAGGDSAAVQEFISTSYDVGSQEYAKMLAVGNGLVYTEDTTDPLVTITSPANETEYEWTMENEFLVELNWTASDPAIGTFNGLDGVKVYVNGVLDPEASGESANISVAAGNNLIRVVATDISGNVGFDEITLIVNDTRPVVDITSMETTYILEPGQSDHSVTVNWVASDLDGLDAIDIYLNEVVEMTLLGSATEYVLSLPLGVHTVTVRANDTLGGWGEDTIVISIIEDAIAPVFDITTDTALYTLTTEDGNMTISVAFTVSDNYREDKLHFDVYLNDVLVGEGLYVTSPIEVLEVGVGAHDITIIVYDYYNNTATDTYLFTIENPAATTEPTTEPDDDPIIPGYSTGFLLIAMVASAGLLIRKRK